ncbi:cation:proton antiporter [Peptostreptococcus canis]|uniref:Sodium:proton antiporter n=1 Tax=Peptostreptococcus canis TaxID=1159213 RepID=A0ABR6TLV8_9FIRM|nr:sodium:proton antiporter [Peptostreptococcus canis]MBC2576218.1 sodium:proton antiporter [Peptostreptococcus canis]MBP1998247.1 NhaP-type Na+/H+ or K+/H+ antiporter [Peptostreptococcus canis]
MTFTTTTAIALIIFLGILSQWVAWKISKPAIVIMSLCGLIIGPLFNIIIPSEIIGEGMYKTIISLSVALILFEGSLSLNFEEIEDTKFTIKRIVIFGAFIAWILGSLAAHFIADLSITTSLVIGAILIVTGPTVILPLLRQAKLDKRVSAILKWEGILVDPLGAILAVFSLELARVISSSGGSDVKILIHFMLGVVAAVIIGYFAAKFMSIALREHYFPEYLKPAIVLAIVIGVFTLSELISHETGLLAVTVLGVAMGNMKISEINDILHFNENISILLTSSVFIMLTASLSREILISVFEPRIILFVLSMLFVVRPLSIWISTIGTDITLQEKALVGWIAPRGIVALTVTGYFSNLLVAQGYKDAEILLALTFALVIVTVFAHGFSIQPLAKKLGVAHDGKPGLIIVGSNKFSVALADFLATVDIPVLIVEYSEYHLKHAIEMDIEHHRGEILYEVANYNLDLVIYKNMLLNTPIPLYNIMVANEFTGRFGRNNVCIVNVLGDKIKNEFKELRHIQSTRLGDYRATYLNLVELVNQGYKFTATKITSEFSTKDYYEKSDFRKINILAMTESGDITFFTTTGQPKVSEGDYIVSLTPPDEMGYNEINFESFEKYEKVLTNIRDKFQKNFNN